jgi:anti-sigma B factor antagonist
MVKSHAEMFLRQHGDVVTLALQGDFDLTTAAQLRDALLHAYRLEPTKLVISLHEVTFLDAVTVGILAAAQAKFRTVGCQIRIQGSTPTQSRVLELAGLAPLLEFTRIPRTRAAE